MLLMQFCGIDTSYNAIRIDPHLTKVISRLAFRFSYQHQWYPPPHPTSSIPHNTPTPLIITRMDQRIRVKLYDSVLTVAVDGDSGSEDKVPIIIRDTLHFLLPGSKMQFHLP